MAADIVIFDEKTVNDKATFNVPHQYSVGFAYVLVNGKLELENGKHTGSEEWDGFVWADEEIAASCVTSYKQ